MSGNDGSPNCGDLCRAPTPTFSAGGARENSAALIEPTPDFFTSSKGDTRQVRPPRLIARSSAEIPKRPSSTIAGWVVEANYGQ